MQKSTVRTGSIYKVENTENLTGDNRWETMLSISLFYSTFLIRLHIFGVELDVFLRSAFWMVLQLMVGSKIFGFLYSMVFGLGQDRRLTGSSSSASNSLLQHHLLSWRLALHNLTLKLQRSALTIESILSAFSQKMVKLFNVYTRLYLRWRDLWCQNFEVSKRCGCSAYFPAFVRPCKSSTTSCCSWVECCNTWKYIVNIIPI